ncbi:hypothetical protein C0Q70_14573 [Pomacea canaliculata]|uniref:Uncharacterized protein n=1 Tax=Pomacea canaliculata TaxID=400727 RepID=A0A2T7NSI1_POMCA|nr:hypothetical protein C0Q70_14573 [Pomacea canaliculata]
MYDDEGMPVEGLLLPSLLRGLREGRSVGETVCGLRVGTVQLRVRAGDAGSVAPSGLRHFLVRVRRDTHVQRLSPHPSWPPGTQHRGHPLVLRFPGMPDSHPPSASDVTRARTLRGSALR